MNITCTLYWGCPGWSCSARRCRWRWPFACVALLCPVGRRRTGPASLLLPQTSSSPGGLACPDESILCRKWRFKDLEIIIYVRICSFSLPITVPPTCMVPLEGLVSAKTGACVRDDAKHGGCQASVQGERTLVLQNLDEHLGRVRDAAWDSCGNKLIVDSSLTTRQLTAVRMCCCRP